jgi:hypothetical protein
MLCVGIRLNLTVTVPDQITFTEFNNMTETIVADATAMRRAHIERRSNFRRTRCSLSTDGVGRIQRTGDMTSAAVDRMACMRQHASRMRRMMNETISAVPRMSESPVRRH